MRTERESQFRDSNSEKHAAKRRRQESRLTSEEDLQKIRHIYTAKLSTYQTLSLYMRDLFGCLPEEPFSTTDMISRWYIIGKERLESELNIEKLLRTLRNLKIHTDLTKKRKASLNLKGKNVIEVDSDEAMEEEFRDELKDRIQS